LPNECSSFFRADGNRVRRWSFIACADEGSVQFRPRGPVKVKGIGQIETWLLKEERRVSSD
jgi:hypothetical protein